MKIYTRINLYFLITFSLVSFITYFVVNHQTLKTIDDQVFSEIYNVNKIRAEHVSTFLKSEKEVIQALASDTNINQTKINNAKQSITQINELYLTDITGKVILSSDSTQIGVDKSKESFFINGLKDVYITNFYLSPVNNKKTYSVSAPVRENKTNKVIGVIVARMNTNNLYRIVTSNISLGTTGESFLVNRDKYFISPSKFLGNDVVLNRKADTQNVRECFQSNSVASIAKQYVDYRSVNVIGTHSYIPEADWCIITKIDYTEILSQNKSITFTTLLFSFTSLLIFSLIGLILSRSITNPIYKLIDSIKKVIDGDYHNKIDISSKDEIGELAVNFNLMIQAVDKSQAEVERKVEEQTKELDNQKNAILNILEDTEENARDLEKFKQAVDNVSDQVVITDPEGIVIYGNKAIKRITGYEVEESLGKKAGLLWRKPMGQDYYENLWKTIKTSKQVYVDEITNIRKNGEEYQAMISISPIIDGNGNIMFFVGIERDITKEKEIDKAKTEFISLASHQLRTPLSTINWYVEMLLSGDAGKINKEQKKFLEEAYSGSQRMVSLVNALLNVSRIESNTYMVEPAPTDVGKLLDSVVFDLKPKINSKKLDISIKKERIPVISLDPNLTNIILQNLITNAVKYTNTGGKIEINMNLKKDTDELLILVKDSGMGIPKSQQDKIFTKLFRADNVQKTDTEGTGLGLYLIKGLIERSKGKIWFDSVENKGSTFYVTLPLSGMKAKEGTKQLS